MRLAPLLASAILLVGLAGCATRPPASDPEALEEFRANNDPLEPLNRTMFSVNNAIDTVALRPAAQAYRFVLPRPVRQGVRNALGNLRGPTILMNDVLQGEVDRAGRTAARFLINSTLGIGGLIDVADWQFGVPGHSEDFGQTLAVWGVGEGPYLYLPILGPSNPRDLLGYGVDVVASPWFWFGQGDVVDALRWAYAGITAIDARESALDTLDRILETSLDPYSTLRSLYRQNRASEIANTGAEGRGVEAGGAGRGVRRDPVPASP
ncbi:MlaA family lipoprotein [Roseococcus pinisoli]|uniref:VacJ family lipoprotein n=1 Tax=Roseococcus pinisoli TaxID=2835040 RepID=A0ABS5Q7U7_9PROT|nr:VacJ family lipoprotein [Roseococcus pinisoli]MBS7809742.1 VacJ family lipoprotein [Roseococcus pinisoli]